MNSTYTSVLFFVRASNEVLPKRVKQCCGNIINNSSRFSVAYVYRGIFHFILTSLVIGFSFSIFKCQCYFGKTNYSAAEWLSENQIWVALTARVLMMEMITVEGYCPGIQGYRRVQGCLATQRDDDNSKKKNTWKYSNRLEGCSSVKGGGASRTRITRGRLLAPLRKHLPSNESTVTLFTVSVNFRTIRQTLQPKLWGNW